MKKSFSIFELKSDFLIILISLIAVFFTSLNNLENKFLPYVKDRQLIDQIRKQKGLIISSLGVQGYENFNIMSYLGRPHYIAGQNLIKVDENLFIDVYCNSIFLNNYENKFNKQKKCFTERTPELWKFIGKYLGATSLIVNSKITVNLPLVAKSKNFKIYKILL
tara:strand:+ start:146 stop:637 length:492 start_codon:yes stop_codon:yes gene_type:complete